MLSNPILLSINFLEIIPQWIEVIALVGSGVGGTVLWWRKEEQQRLSGLENATDKIINSYDSLLDELKLATQERESKIDVLENEKQSLSRKLYKAESTIDKQKITIEGLKFLNKFISESIDAPEEVRAYLQTSALKEFLDGERSIRDILFQKIESID